MMNPRESESTPFDVYSDLLDLSITPTGTSLNFSRSSETDNTDILQGVVHVSNEMLKLMAYFMRESIVHHEHQFGVTWPIPSQILEDLGIDIKDWERFWLPHNEEGA